MRRLVALLLVPLLVVPLVLDGDAVAAQPLQELQRRLADAQAERADLERRVASAIERIEDLEARIVASEAEREQVEAELATLRAASDEIAELVTFRVRETFKHGSTLDPLAVFLASDDPEAALSRAETIARVVAGDQARGETLLAARTRVDAAEQRLAATTDELVAARREQAAVTAELQADFTRVQELEQQLTREERAERERLERERREREERERREREERERREREERAARERSSAAAPATSRGAGGPGSSGSTPTAPSAPSAPAAPSTSGGWACPLDRPRHFVDSWGAPRSGGRAHRGTDIMGPRGIPVRAITSGTWTVQRPGPSAGLWGILRADNGDQYWYMHLDSHTVASGTRVTAGQQVGTNGSTGNATAGAEHVHFELHPGGGSAVNPFPLLRRVCG